MSELPPPDPDQSNNPGSHEPLATREQARLILGEFERLLAGAPSEPFMDTTYKEDFIEPYQLNLWADPIRMPSDDDIDVRVKANLHFASPDGFKYQYYLRAEEDAREQDGWAYTLASRQVVQQETLTSFDEGFMSGARVEIDMESSQDEARAHADEIRLGLTDATSQEAELLLAGLKDIDL